MRIIVEHKNDDHFILSTSNLEHIKANRIKQDSQIYCLYNNVYFLCKLKKNIAIIIEKLNINNEFQHEIIVGMPLIKYKKIDFLIQKLTELGVKKIHLLKTANISVKYNEKDLTKKIDRWNKISQSAVEQSFRNNKLEILPLQTLNEFVSLYNDFNKYIAHEKISIEQNIQSFSGNLVFLFGPEGGFDDHEVNLAIQNGYQPISLGKRILRAETAILKMISKICDSN